MSTDKRNLAVYLDELDADPFRACEIARSLGIEHICLRRVWSTNIGRATDDACKQLIAAIRKAKLSVLMICTEDGRCPAESLMYDQTIKRSLMIAAYFKARFFRPFIGLNAPRLSSDHDAALAKIDEWMDAIGGECARTSAANGTVPLLEIDPDAQLFEANDVAALLDKHKSWKLLYDPSLLIAKRNQNPMERYWYLLRNRVGAIDLHDFKRGSGFVPVGVGDCLMNETIADCVTNRYDGWFVIEPGVARRSNPSMSRKAIAQAVIDNYFSAVTKAKQGVADATKRAR